jgi:hypothetical protein|tara:strand:+ start:438 stop:647 length:210 start_codon:yes stop_codon:yes gene_type:complete
MKNKISDARRNQANKQEEFLRPIKIAEELGYEFDIHFFGGNIVFYKTNNDGFKVYSTIAEILEEYQNHN